MSPRPSVGAEAARSRPLVSVCLPVRNGAQHLSDTIRSVLAQDHEELELVVSDNASTDETEDVCRELARSDSRIAYHRHAENVGLLNNFIGAMRMAHGTFFRWLGHDDWLPPNSISRSLEPLVQSDAPILATMRVSYTDEDGVTWTNDSYDGRRLASDDPIVRFTEMLRLLNESMLVDPLYGLFRRSPVSTIPRRNMLKEDEVFATKLALAGPWAHVPEVLVHRKTTRSDSLSALARRLGVPAWRTHVACELQSREILHWLEHEPLTPEQRREARAAVRRMYLRRQRILVTRRTRKLVRNAARVGRRR